MKSQKKGGAKKKDKKVDPSVKTDKKMDKKTNKQYSDERLLEREKSLKKIEKMIGSFYSEKLPPIKGVPKETDPILQLQIIFKTCEKYLNSQEQNNQQVPPKGSSLKKDSVTMKFQFKQPEPKMSAPRSVTKNFVGKQKNSTKPTFASNRNLTSSQSMAELNSLSTKKNMIKSSLYINSNGENQEHN